MLVYIFLLRLCLGCEEPLVLQYPDGKEYLFSPAHYQMKLESFYLDNDRPPFKESHFLLGLPANESDRLQKICPGAWIFSRLVGFETFSFTEGPELASVQLLDPVRSFLLTEKLVDLHLSWPLEPAMNRISTIKKVQTTPVSLSFVVCHCREDLSWLHSTNITHIPDNSALYVYEKCGHNSEPDLESVRPRFSRGLFVIDKPDGEVRGDECSGFLDYLVEQYDGALDARHVLGISHYTILLQSDPQNHLFLSYLDVALRGISSGAYNVPFLHLNFHRHVQTSTPCMRDVEAFLFQQAAPTTLLGTYCCSQFIVSRDRILAHPKSFYEHMLKMVDGTYPDHCVNGKPKRSSQCYVFEFLWHVVFGEPRDLPLRPDDTRLPIALRMKYGNEHVRTWWEDVDLAPGSNRPLSVTWEL